MSKQLRELQARKATLVKDARALTDIAAAQARDMNDEEVAAFEALKIRKRPCRQTHRQGRALQNPQQPRVPWPDPPQRCGPLR